MSSDRRCEAGWSCRAWPAPRAFGEVGPDGQRCESGGLGTDMGRGTPCPPVSPLATADSDSLREDGLLAAMLSVEGLVVSGGGAAALGSRPVPLMRSQSW